MTPLERLLLTHVFQAKPQGESLYLYAAEEPSSVLCLDRGPVEAAARPLELIRPRLQFPNNRTNVQ